MRALKGLDFKKKGEDYHLKNYLQCEVDFLQKFELLAKQTMCEHLGSDTGV